MTKLVTKEQILESAGYSYNFDRELYLNRSAKKAFSIDFLEDHSEQEIEKYIKEDAPAREGWRFFFNHPPSDTVKRELTIILG